MSDATPLVLKEIIDNLRSRNGWTLIECQNFWKVFLKAFYGGLQKDKRVVFSRFGSFKVRHKKERAFGARDPRTLEPGIVSARNVVKFVPSVELKMQVRDK